MPKFLAGCHYNEEEITQDLGKKIYIYIGWSDGNMIATGQILKKNR